MCVREKRKHLRRLSLYYSQYKNIVVAPENLIRFIARPHTYNHHANAQQHTTHTTHTTSNPTPFKKHAIMAAAVIAPAMACLSQSPAKHVNNIIKKPAVVLVKDEHISTEDQIKLIDAGIVYPVDSKAYLSYLGDDVNVISNKVVYVPNIGDRLVDVIHDQPAGSGNPLAAHNQSDMCLVITPPIQGFDYDKFANGNVMYPKHFGCLDQDIFSTPVAACRGYLPEHFVENAQRVKNITLETIAQLSKEDAPFEVVGAKLNPLSSGMGNIVLYVKFPMGCPFNQQQYVPIRGTNMKVRIVPTPFITKNSQTKIHNVDIIVKVSNADELMFQKMYAYAVMMMDKDMHCKLKHVRTLKSDGSIVIAGHSLKTIDLNTAVVKSLKKSITSAFLDNGYIVSDVSFRQFDNY